MVSVLVRELNCWFRVRKIDVPRELNTYLTILQCDHHLFIVTGYHVTKFMAKARQSLNLAAATSALSTLSKRTNLAESYGI
jgi:hypothetical protein